MWEGSVPSPRSWVWIGGTHEFFYCQNGEWSCILGSKLPVLPESEVRVQVKFIGDRSNILETIITPSENCAQKMTKLRQKLCCFVHSPCLFS